MTATPNPANDAVSDVLTTIRLWQQLGITAGMAWQALGRQGECTSWAMVAGFMGWWLRDQKQQPQPYRRAA